ncbi:MAG: DNA adenine methylase [Tannerellaceae bacterium]|jgi:DNA adenine methylase|nr:DNA adenine methylase [Tannerellaceae bacterium]
MKLPHPIPYQGSKRNLADKILQYFPAGFDRLIEPFAGSAAISIASAFYFKANRFVLNDINKPLTDLWDTIINNPKYIIGQYNDIWQGQRGNEEEYYYEIRDKFNETQQPEYLLFLLAKCVKAAVRYNAQGNFNQSPDKRRLGRNPRMMRDNIIAVSQLLKGKTEVFSTDYSHILESATTDDLIYMDPPYQGTGQNGGFNYAGNINFDDFVISLYKLNQREIPYVLSYDGRTGDKTFGKPLPNALNLTKVEINAGRSTQATLLSREEYTYEAVYLSPVLVKRIDKRKIEQSYHHQHELFACYD